MLTASRALATSHESSPELPHVPMFTALYRRGVHPRVGEVIMIAGRSGTQKSGFALAWSAELAAAGTSVLYFSADMSAFQASIRLACNRSGEPTEVVEQGMLTPEGQAKYLALLADLPISFSFGSPIKWQTVEEELDAYVELHNAFPKVLIFDNLMDFDGAASGYEQQMDTMQLLSDLSRFTGSTVVVLHHASDKTWDAKASPWKPPSRDQIKGGMSEKPELVLTVALDPHTNSYRVACVKQRMGPCDPSAESAAEMIAEPSLTRFRPYEAITTVKEFSPIGKVS